MATKTLPFLPTERQQDSIINYLSACYETQNMWNTRSHMLAVDKAYAREVSQDEENRRAKLYNRAGDYSRFQAPEVPVVMPAVEEAVNYQFSVFLASQPLFGVAASAKFIDEAKALEALIEENSLRTGWSAEIGKAIRDGFKYNVGAVEVVWESRKSYSLATDITASPTEGQQKEVVWNGNVVRSLDMYNLFWDRRVSPVDVPEFGEFAGYTKMMSRMALKQFISDLDTKIIANVNKAYEAGTPDTTNASSAAYYTPEVVSARFREAGIKEFDWNRWFNNEAQGKRPVDYHNSYEVAVIYARILPSDFGFRVPAPNTPQVWKFIIVNRSVVIYVERQTNAHNLIPILFCQPYEDGLGYQTKSLADNVTGLQDISSTMWQSIIAARRRAVNDRIAYDQSRVSRAHMESPNPVSRVPVRPSAYNKDVGSAFYQFPFRDDQSGTLMQEVAALSGMANTITGQNAARQGQFVRGNKSRKEFDTIMNNATGRDQVTALLLQLRFFTPMKHILKTNYLQFQTAATIYSPSKDLDVEIDPAKLRTAVLEFKLTDGMRPTEKVMGVDVLQQAFSALSSIPGLAQGYNVNPLFSYLVKLQGASLTDFEKPPEQIAYEQAMAQWQQAAQASEQPFQIPMPQPQQYGYNPAQASQPSTAAAAPAPRVNNITNNITNNEG